MLGDARALAARQRLQQAGDDEHALHVVERAAADRKPRVAAGGDAIELRLQRLGQVQPLDLGARDHHRADLALVEAEDVAHHLVLLGLDHARLAPLFELGRDLLLGHADPRRLAAQPEQPQHRVRDADSSTTKGLVAVDSHIIGRAASRATGSGYICPMRLGTSSPKMIVK